MTPYQALVVLGGSAIFGLLCYLAIWLSRTDRFAERVADLEKRTDHHESEIVDHSIRLDRLGRIDHDVLIADDCGSVRMLSTLKEDGPRSGIVPAKLNVDYSPPVDSGPWL